MPDVVPLRRNRPFQLLWIGSAVSRLGTELTRFAMPLLVLALAGSPGWAGVVAGARTAAFLGVQLPAGIWVDRWDRRRALLLSQGAQALTAAAPAVVVVAGEVRIRHFLALGVDGVCGAFGGPARTVAIRGVVPDEQLRGAYARRKPARTRPGWSAHRWADCCSAWDARSRSSPTRSPTWSRSCAR